MGGDRRPGLRRDGDGEDEAFLCAPPATGASRQGHRKICMAFVRDITGKSAACFFVRVFMFLCKTFTFWARCILGENIYQLCNGLLGDKDAFRGSYAAAVETVRF